MSYTSISEIKEAVELNGCVLTITMMELRDAYGAGRLGVHVRTAISNELRGAGLAHYPEPLTDSQYDSVRIYKQGTSVASLIGAAMSPGADADQRLREATGGDAERLLAQVKELVCS